MDYEFKINGISETKLFAIKLARSIEPSLAIALKGTLGAGKTSLIRFALEHLGVNGPIKSPTYALVEEYNLTKFDVYHFDLYRFEDKTEWLDLGFDDYFNDRSVCFIEWAELAGDLIPYVDLKINIAIDRKLSDSRVIKIESLSNRGDEWLQKFLKFDIIC